MGIKNLMKIIGDHASSSMAEHDLNTYFGRKLAIDASMSIYQFLVAVRQGADNLQNSRGEITSHLSGLFYRTVRILEAGIKPVYVFDGKPPQFKSEELKKRTEAKRLAQEMADKAKEEGDAEAYERYSRRVNKVTPEMTAQCKKLLQLMGVPIVEAPCEAEAQCAAMCKAGIVYATASEDMDSLTLGTPRLIRYLWAGAASSAEKKGTKPLEFHLDSVLQELGLSMDSFIDLCILCGCDYQDGIKGIGPHTAYKLIQEHGSLETVVSHLNKEGKHPVPDPYFIDEIRSLFKHPDVQPADKIALKWNDPDEEGLVEFMVHENQFSETNIRSGVKKMLASKGKGSQMRIDSFFSVSAAKPKPKSKEGDKGKDAKRKSGSTVASSSKKSKK